ncbi:MAG: protein kinase [Myxococcales bacterium]|nr:protein kinase [Myxococcales bacterium]
MTDLSLPPGIAARVTAESLLHQGRMGAAYMARSASGTGGVLRMLDTSLTRSATDRMRLARGLDKLMTVSHPNLVVPLEHGEDGGQLWYLRPYVAGTTLSERLAQGPLPMDEALSVCGQVADALHALHRAGLLHRDLCPERIILQADGRAVILDATVAAPVDSAHERVFGTAPFVSPEEVEGKPTSFRSDLYALGCILYAALAGEPPFDGAIADVLSAQLNQTPPPLKVELGAEVRTLLDQLLDKEPRRRPFSAQKVARTLVTFVPVALRPGDAAAGPPSGTRAPVPAAPRPAAPSRPHAATLMGVPAVVPPPAAAEPSTASRSAPPPLPGGRQPSVPPPVPTAPRQPSVPPPLPGGRSPKRTMLGMPAITAPTGPFRDDATQQVQLEQIVEARELRGRTPSAAPPLGTTSTSPRNDSTQQVELEQIVEVRASRLPPPPPPALDQTAQDLPAPPPLATGFEDDEPTRMFEGSIEESAAAQATAASTGFDEDEPTRMFDGGLGGDEPPTTEMALPPDVEDDAASASASASFDADEEPTSMFSSHDLTPSEPPPAMGLAAPIIAPASVPPPSLGEPATAPLGTMPMAPPPRVSAPPPLAAAAQAVPPVAASAPMPVPSSAADIAPPPAFSAQPAPAAPSAFAAQPAAVAAPASPAASAASAPAGDPVLAHPIPDEGSKRRWVIPAAVIGLLMLMSACAVGIWLYSSSDDADGSANPPVAANTGDTTTLTAPALIPDAGALVAAAPPDLGPPDLGPPDLGPPDLGPPDLGPPDLGPPDLGPPDAGALDDEAFMNGPRPRGRAERARWLALRRERAAASRMAAAPGSANASAARGVQDRARAATAAGNHAEATRLYEQLTRMTPSSAGAWYSLGVSRMRQRNGRGAAAALERATQLSPRNANYWATLGTARRNAGDAGGARAAFQQALRFDPNNATARRGLGQ